MRGSNFVFDQVQLLYYRCQKINFNRDGSYIDSPDLIKNIKATINPINKKDNKCFQYVLTLNLNLKKLKKDPQRITKIKPFINIINIYNWKGINFLSKKDHWKKFEKNNEIIALNDFYAKREKIYPAYVSKHNWKRYRLFS